MQVGMHWRNTEKEAVGVQTSGGQGVFLILVKSTMLEGLYYRNPGGRTADANLGLLYVRHCRARPGMA